MDCADTQIGNASQDNQICRLFERRVCAKKIIMILNDLENHLGAVYDHFYDRKDSYAQVILCFEFSYHCFLHLRYSKTR